MTNKKARTLPPKARHSPRNGPTSGLGIEKIATEIPGFDFVGEGGLPRGRTTLIAGTAGSGKTVFATHFLAAGIEHSGEPGVFATFEDDPEGIRRNMMGFGWDIRRWEEDDKWCFVDVSPDPSGPTPIVGSYDLGGLISRIEHAARKLGATRIVLDSLNALFIQIPDKTLLRMELFRLIQTLKGLGATVVFTGGAHPGLRRGDTSRYRGVRRRQRDHPPEHPRR